MDETEAIRLRAAEEADQDFLFELLASTRPDLSLIDGPARSMLLRLQLEAQHAHYRQHFPQLEANVVLVGDQRAGRLCVARTDNEIRLLDISLLPGFRNRHIGGHLLSTLQEAARHLGLPLRLHVLQDNPARHLYERHGFQPGALDGLHLSMEWSAVSRV
ncbi:GNAT family N-acetyltransferase [Pseudoduganella sp. RAF53_2]|uniref:GNAT family N-acetyltransferase n=1 Tax=unclassified Pseudoduganella TaxID=2637179 RepID=UPI003F9D076D